MMNVSFILRCASVLVYALAATVGLSQDVPSIPPSADPTFWGQPNKPYTLKLTQTSIGVSGSNTPQTHVSEVNVCRDSAGRVRTESFYDSGLPMAVSVRDPNKNTMTQMMVVGKTFFVISVPRPMNPPPGRGWTVERLAARVIDGFPVEGLRFTRTIPANANGNDAPDSVIDEEWLSNNLGVVLEEKTESQRIGTTTKKVSQLKQVEPDPTLFTVPSDYSVRQAEPPAQRP
jgi:hypothetical protein